jgi:arylsulfatase A-like enzyme
MRRSIFLPTAVLGLVFIVAKAVLVWKKLPNHPLLFFTISAEDVLTVCLAGLAASVLLAATSRWKRLHRVTGITAVILGSIAAIFAVANIAIVHTLGYPLNARMLALAGRFTDLRSSMFEQASVGLVAGMVAAPLVFILASLWRFRIAPSRKIVAGIMALAICWISFGLVLRARAEPGAWEIRAGHNPHREFLGTLASRLLFDRRVELVGPYPAADMDDFKPAADRALPPLPRFSPPPRNVIMVVLESTAAQYLSLYGASFDTTPNLVAESAHGMIFDRFYSHVGYTYCARMPLFFSVYPGLPWCYCYPDTRPIQPALPALLAQRGWRTALFTAADPEYDQLKYIAADAGLKEIFGPEELGGRMASSWGTEDGILIDGLIKWIDADKSHKPFYAIAWTDQTHHPYTLSADTKPIEFVKADSMAHAEEFNRYLNAIRQADRHLGRLFQALRDRHLADDTLVVITGDHGEAFGDLHDVMGHGGGIYQENLRVPMMLWNPRLFPAGQRSQTPGGHVDINPTLAHLLGIAPPAHWQGASLFSPDHPNRVYLLADRSDYEFAVTDGRYKYALYQTDGFEKLFDLENDPHEQHDILSVHGDLTAEMRQRVSAFVHSEELFLKPNPAK